MSSGILPDADLPSGVGGQGRLRRLGQVGRAARAGVLAAAAVALVTAPLRGGLVAFQGLPAWLLVGTRSSALVALALFVLLVAWSQRSLRRLPPLLRYTCSFDTFTPAPGYAPPVGTASLHHDLAGLLLSRHPRLGLRDQARGPEECDDRFSVHIGGVRSVRPGRDGGAYVEVRPSVHVGAPTRPGGLACPASVRMEGEELSPDEYAMLLERICASVADELYGQLEHDATDQLAFLPTRNLRARWLFHEAEDHARSNTARASERARRLYELAAARLGPGRRPLPPTGLRRAGALAALAAARGSGFLRRAAARAAPQLADRDVLWARCQIGSASALMDRRIRTGLPGQQPTTIYEAAPVVRSALSRLESLPAGAPGRNAGLVDGQVVFALVLAHLDDRPRGRRHLDRARAADPVRAEHDPAYLLAAGELDQGAAARARLLRRAATLNARSGTARWRLALEVDRAWRSAEHLDPTEAQRVIAGYRAVLALDPGHLGAWAGIGHVRWLLGQLPDARETFVTGWDARPLGTEAFVTEFDLGRARVAAESGRFAEAYRHTLDATAGLLVEGVPQLPDGAPRSYGAWYFSRSPAAVDRGCRYREHVDAQLEKARGSGRWSPAVLDTVDAFVWYDLGECLRHAGRLDEAEEALLRAAASDPGLVLAHFQLGDLYRRRDDEPRARAAADEVSRREPSWTTGALARALNDAHGVAAARRRSARATRAVADREAERATVERRRFALGLTAARTGAHGSNGTRAMSVLEAARHAVGSDPPGHQGTRSAPKEVGNAGVPEPPAGAVGDVAPQPSGSRLAADLERLDAEIREQRRRRDRHDAQARQAARALRETVPAIVPHAWLWRHTDGEASLDWLALNPPDPRLERRWERQLAERHAVALYLYGHSWLRSPPEGVREDLAYQRAAGLLRCVRDRFLPRNRAVVVDLLLAEAAVGARARITELVADVACDADEEAKQVLSEVLAVDNDDRPDWQADVLIPACEHDGFSPGVSAWMADQAVTRLLPRVDPGRHGRLTAAARASFLRGLHSPQATDLLLVGEGLSGLCDHEHAAQAYRSALAVVAGGASGDQALADRATLRLAATDFLAGRWTPSEAPPAESGMLLTRAGIAEAISRELATGVQRPCADVPALDAAYAAARLWVAGERETASRAQDEDAWRDAEGARLALVAARPPASGTRQPTSGTRLEARLPGFLGVQDVRDALEAWAAKGDGTPGADPGSAMAALRRGPELRTLTVCLRALLRDRVPIDDLGPLVDAYRQARPGAGTVCSLVRELRRSVRDRLPGNAPGWQRLPLPADLEADVRDRLDPADLAPASPEDLEHLLAAVRSTLGAVADQRVAVVTDPPLRFAVRWLVAVEHPQVPVLASDEVVTTIRLPDDPAPPTRVQERTEEESAR